MKRKILQLHFCCAIIGLALWIVVCAAQYKSEVEIRSHPLWGAECPRECQCHLTALRHAAMTKWVDPNVGSSRPKSYSKSVQQMAPLLKVAMCVLGVDTVLSKVIRRLPQDTQVLTFLQSQDSPPMVLMEQHSQHLQHLLALEVKGHTSHAPHFAIGSHALRPMRRLQYLALNGVDLSAQPVGLSKLHNLRSLTLQENGLDELTRDTLLGLLSLEDLTISHNGLLEVPALAFVDLPALRLLRLSGNRIGHLDANSFVNLDDLELLDLSGNNISDVSMISFPPLPKLQRLQLQNNPIRVLFLNAFHFLNATVILTLGHKEQPLHIMKYSFAGLHSLKSLLIPNLDNQILEKDMFSGLDSLQSLTLRGTIKSVGSEAFAGAYRLEKLVLRHCHLRRLSSEAFQGLKHLRSLDLSGNSISKIPLGLFDNTKSLQELELQHNNLHYLPPQLLAQLHLQLLRLEANPWHCTCAMAKLDRAPIGRVKTVGYKRCNNGSALVKEESEAEAPGCQRLRVRYVRDPAFRPVCESPAELKGKRIFEAVRKNLKCYEETGKA